MDDDDTAFTQLFSSRAGMVPNVINKNFFRLDITCQCHKRLTYRFKSKQTIHQLLLNRVATTAYYKVVIGQVSYHRESHNKTSQHLFLSRLQSQAQ